MTEGTITSSTQGFVKAEVQLEDGTYLETFVGGTPASTPINESVGQAFTATKAFSRIKVVIANGGGNKLGFAVYDGPAKTNLLHNVPIAGAGVSSVAHVVFDAMPAGSYYWEIVVLSGSGTTYISCMAGSSIKTAYTDGTLDTSIDFKSKIMYSAAAVIAPLAIEGDVVDSGITTVAATDNIFAVQVGEVVGNLACVGDALNNGGIIISGAWFINTE